MSPGYAPGMSKDVIICQNDKRQRNVVWEERDGRMEPLTSADRLLLSPVSECNFKAYDKKRR